MMWDKKKIVLHESFVSICPSSASQFADLVYLLALGGNGVNFNKALPFASAVMRCCVLFVVSLNPLPPERTFYSVWGNRRGF